MPPKVESASMKAWPTLSEKVQDLKKNLEEKAEVLRQLKEDRGTTEDEERRELSSAIRILETSGQTFY